MARNTTRASQILESYDDVITGMMNDMDAYARQSGGYMNRMHPDQFNQDGTRKDTVSEMSYNMSKNRRKAKMAAMLHGTMEK